MAAIGAAFWSVAQMLSGAATGFGTMLLTRLGFGVRRGADIPGQLSQRARLGAVYRAWIGGRLHPGVETLLGPALSAPLAAWLIEATSWRVSFVVTGAIGLVWVGLWFM